ncbi:MAG TPA: hypothetical protein VFG11_03320 [Acidobacteriota bacterium]|nr:hypothetical protein [Acidobacteriota bacterium]
MSKQEICRIIGGLLVVLIGIAVGIGGIQLWNGAPASWRDITASNSTAKNSARTILVVAVMLFIGGIAATFNLNWGQWAASIAIVIFVIGGFWANHLLFGSIRPGHTITNVIVGAVILWLLRIGYAGH